MLAGDPKQLGPVIRSRWAVMGQLDMSLLERLSEKEQIYKKENGEYNEVVITKLIVNYRSHQGLLKLPNDLFYDRELVANAIQTNAKYSQWVKEVTEYENSIPMIFHGIPGC